VIRRLIVLRHAHAHPAAPGEADVNRHLDALGISEAVQVGVDLSAGNWVPDAIVVSYAARARETLSHVITAFACPVPVDVSRSLYGAGWDRAVEELASLPDDVATAMVVGHNPGLEEIVERAIGAAGIALGTATAALLVGRGTTWSEALHPGAWSLVGRVVPRFDPSTRAHE
jgi:phosphohistidine phosphatase